MKKLFLVLLISLSFLLVFSGCSATGNTNADKESEAEEEAGLEKPVSDVKDGDGLQGTWQATDEEDDNTVTSVLALNSNDTYELWLASNSSSAANVESSVSGTYTSTDTTLTLTPDEGDGDKADYTYVLNGDTLDLTQPDGTVLHMTREKS